MSNKEFYRNCYLKTGWLPAQPLMHELAVGDVCQIKSGRLMPLLNIGDAHLIENLVLADDIALDGYGWHLSQGMQQTSHETLIEQDTEGQEGEKYHFSRQVIELKSQGDFIFHARAPQACLLLNWHQIRDDLTLKLTQLHYSFRQAYVITGVASAHDWALAVAGQVNARLEMSVKLASHDCYHLLSHESALAERSQGLACYEASRGRTAYFLKAKKMVMSDAMTDRYLSKVIENKDELSSGEVANWLQTDLLNQVKTNELNLNTSISFFTWVDLSLDDVELLTD